MGILMNLHFAGLDDLSCYVMVQVERKYLTWNV